MSKRHKKSRKPRKRGAACKAEAADDQRSQRYKHDDLPDQERSFRLLELLPGRKGTAIHCRLRTYSINFHPPYEAMSYVWGDPDDRTDIFCHRKRVRIPWNLHDALERLRHTHESRILWADSICVNQDDTKERGHQVQLMRQIFYRAENVNAWVGRGDDFDAEAAFNLVRRLHEACETNDRATIRLHVEETPDFEWNALKRLCRKDYFRRVWILQEIGLACSVVLHCGRIQLEWEQVKALETAYQHSPGVGTNLWYCWGLFLKMDMGFRSRRNQDVRIIVAVSSNCGCIDPRDKYYGIIGHAAFEQLRKSSNGEPFLTVDYSLPVAAVYLNAARQLLRLAEPLYLLSMVNHEAGHLGMDGIPSWVPQCKPSLCHSLTSIPGSISPFSAGTQQSSQFRVRGPSLEVVGVCVDSIDWTSDIFRRSVQNHSKTLEGIWGKISNVDGFHRSSMVVILRRLCSTLSADYKLKRRPKGSKPIDAYFHMILSGCLAFFEREDIYKENDEVLKAGYGGAIEFFTQLLCIYPFRRRFFVTAKGFFGLCPLFADPGDKICIFYGTQVPCVLRPTGQAGQYWFCGDCYLEEWMYGKATDMWGPDESETFTLV